MMTAYALADELLDAERRRNKAAQDLEAAHRKALEALETLRRADEEVSRLRTRLTVEVGG